MLGARVWSPRNSKTNPACLVACEHPIPREHLFERCMAPGSKTRSNVLWETLASQEIFIYTWMVTGEFQTTTVSFQLVFTPVMPVMYDVNCFCDLRPDVIWKGRSRKFPTCQSKVNTPRNVNLKHRETGILILLPWNRKHQAMSIRHLGVWFNATNQSGLMNALWISPTSWTQVAYHQLSLLTIAAKYTQVD